MIRKTSNCERAVQSLTDYNKEEDNFQLVLTLNCIQVTGLPLIRQYSQQFLHLFHDNM